MKKSSFVFGFIAICFLISANTYAAGEYTLAYSLKKGDVFKQLLPMAVKTSMNMMGQNIDILINVETSFAIKVTDVESDTYTLECSYTRFKMLTENNLVQFNIDTDNPDAGGQFAEVSGLLKSIIDIPLTVKIDRRGNATAISGIDRQQEALAGMAAKSNNPMTRQLSAGTLKQQYSEASFKDMLGQLLVIFPEKPVKTGESWNSINSKAVAEAEIKIKVKHTLKAVEGNIAIIESAGEMENESAMVETPQGNVTYTMKGNFASAVRVNLKNGMALSGQNSMDCELQMGVQGTEIPMKMQIAGKLICE